MPRLMCRNGRIDQETLSGRLRNLRERGYTDQDLELVFDGISPELVLNPWAVANNRMRSIDRLEAHLALVGKRKAEASSAEQTDPGACPVHRTTYVAEWSTPGVPYCVLCEQEKAEEAKELRARSAASDGQEYVEYTDEPDSDEALAAVMKASLDGAAARKHRAAAREAMAKNKAEREAKESTRQAAVQKALAGIIDGADQEVADRQIRTR